MIAVEPPAGPYQSLAYYDKEAAISLATVYNNLELFVEHGRSGK